MERIQATPRPCHHYRFPIRLVRRPPPPGTPPSLEQISQSQTTLMNWRCGEEFSPSYDLTDHLRRCTGPRRSALGAGRLSHRFEGRAKRHTTLWNPERSAWIKDSQAIKGLLGRIAVLYFPFSKITRNSTTRMPDSGWEMDLGRLRDLFEREIIGARPEDADRD